MLKRCLVFTTLILLMVALTAADILAQQNMTAKTQPFDDESAKKVDAFLSQWDKNDMPGGAVGVVKDGKLVYKRAFGMANLDSISLEPCDVPAPPPAKTQKVLCGKYEVFENRALKKGRKISLKVVVFPATGQNKAPDPVFYIAGGPGSSAIEEAPYV
ncbi:MAG: hypothetical protein LC768_13360, partial [Acidobacteria bacterium]|nr:hypothetical protein [Acidobacteriota bacterium]